MPSPCPSAISTGPLAASAFGHICPMAMPPGYRLDVHEGHAFAVAPDEAAGDLAVDDSGKDAAHVVLLLGLSIVLGTFCFFLFGNPLFRLVDHVIVIDQREAGRLVCAYCASHLGIKGFFCFFSGEARGPCTPSCIAGRQPPGPSHAMNCCRMRNSSAESTPETGTVTTQAAAIVTKWERRTRRRRLRSSGASTLPCTAPSARERRAACHSR